MKVLALNGSPRMKASSTYHMLIPFLAGMEAAGAETEVIHIRRLNLEACIGCYTCWARTPGVCIHDDSMADALQKFNTADMVIFGTPLYHFTMTGIMKNFVDRLLPRLEPWLIPHPHVPGVTGHPERVNKPNKMFLISPCGFPEFEHFDSLVATFKHIARMENWEYMGEILRPGAEPLSRRSLQNLFTNYYTLLRQAGEELVRDERISDDLQAKLHQDLFPGGKKAFYQLAEGYWTEQMDKFKVPQDQRHTVPLLAKDLDSTPMAPAGSDISADIPKIGDRYYVPNEIIMQTMAAMYDAKAMPNLQATIQFQIIPPKVDFDPGAAAWYLEINGARCDLHQSKTAIPTLTVTTPYEVWYDIGMGDLDALEAFTDGDYEATGSQKLLNDMLRLFPRPEPGSDDSLVAELDTIMLGMPTAFKPKAAQGINAIIQFILSGKGGGLYFLTIADGECTAQRGASKNPTMTIHSPAEIWLAISKGELDGQKAFMEEKYRVSGDMAILLKFNAMFDTHPTDAGENLPPSSEEVTEDTTTQKEESQKMDISNLNLKQTLAGMPTVFNPDVAGNLVADIQFHVTGDEPGDYYLNIANRKCTFQEGLSQDPSLTINTPSEVWLKISRGEMNGALAFMTRKYKVTGNMGLLMKFNKMFKT
ncbi:SCP2 sterol-binding domain-containing protein [Anaerolineales bacterium HSG6]|nr:SCP2 sterol-binding domain-containing protein [Anaerolineales bacterium HSG6]